MEGKDYKDIERIIIRQPDNSESEIFSKFNIFIFKEGKKPEIRTFDDRSECMNFAAEIIENKYTSIDDAQEKNEKDNFVMMYNPIETLNFDKVVKAYTAARIESPSIEISPELTNQIMTGNISKDNKQKTEENNKEELEDEEHRFSKPVRVGAGILAGALAVGTVVGLGSAIIQNVQNSNDAEKDLDKEIDYSSMSIEELLDKLEDNSLAKKEYSKALDFCNRFNSLTKDANNFYLESDKDNHLTISAEEALYTSVVLNNNTADELLKIFGTKTLDYNKVMNAYNNVCEKIKIYNMNAKQESGLDMLMNKPDLYRATEKSILEFNKNNTTEMSDQAIVTLKNNFINYDGIKEDNDATIEMSTMPIYGYKNANANNEELLKYKGSFDGEDIKDGEKITDILQQISKKHSTSSVSKTVKSNIDEYNSKLAAILASSKNELVEALRDNGNDALADKVQTSDDITVFEDEIGNKGAEFSKLFDDYQEKVNSLNPSGIKADTFIGAINKEVLDGSKCDLNTLINNRVKKEIKKEKIDDNNSVEEVDTPPVYYDDNNTDPDYYNDNDSDYEEEPTYDDNVEEDSNEENVEVEDEEEIEEQTEVVDQTEEGYNSVDDYVNTPGAYKYNGEIKNKYMSDAYTKEELEQMTPSQLWKEMMKAGIKLPDLENDEQLKEELLKISAGKDQTFTDAWKEKINEELSNSYYSGQEEMIALEEKYQITQGQVETLNNGGNITTDEVIEPDYSEYSNNYEYEVNYIDGYDDSTFTNNNNDTEYKSTAEDNSGYAEAVDDEVETTSFDDYGGYTLTK